MYNVVDIADELQNYDKLFEDMNGAGWSADLGNQGKFCTITVECMLVCTWF